MRRRVPPPIAPPSPRLGEALDFMRLLWAVDHGLQTTSKRMKTELGVTGPQRLVIRIVARFPGIPPGQVAQLIHIHPSTLTGVLKRLESRGLISRRTDPEDRRRSFLAVTPKGRGIDLAGRGTVESAVERLLARTPPARIQVACEILAAFAECLREPPSSPP